MKKHTPESLETSAEEINEVHEDLMRFAMQVGAMPLNDTVRYMSGAAAEHDFGA